MVSIHLAEFPKYQEEMIDKELEARMPVSYTHLDVYKRQIFFSPIFNFADAAISCGIIALLLFYSKYLNESCLLYTSFNMHSRECSLHVILLFRLMENGRKPLRIQK